MGHASRLKRERRAKQRASERADLRDRAERCGHFEQSTKTRCPGTATWEIRAQKPIPIFDKPGQPPTRMRIEEGFIRCCDDHARALKGRQGVIEIKPLASR